MLSQAPRVCLVTGAARRIGSCIARTYHAHGYHVIVHYRHSSTEAQQLVTELNAHRENSAAMFYADLCDLDAVNRLATLAHAVWGRLDVLVNNASVFFPTSHQLFSEDVYDRLMHANVRAPWALSFACYAFLKETHGNIVNISDIQGIEPIRDYALYAMTQASRLMMTTSLAKEWKGDVRVNAVAPGPILPPEGAAAMSAHDYAQLALKTKNKTLPSPNDVAVACLSLSNSNDTAKVIYVDGGRLSLRV